MNNSNKTHFYIQNDYANSTESRAILEATLLNDCYTYHIIQDIPEFIYHNDVPIGSVEWCRLFASRQGRKLDEHIDYPIHFTEILRRDIQVVTVDLLKPGMWVKPTYTKLFPAQLVTEHSPVMHDNGDPVAHDALCWASEVVMFGPEFRCYVQDRNIVGISQYDESQSSSLSDVNIEHLDSLIKTWDNPMVTYALDVGLLEDTNEMALVEVNASWGTGYYPGGTLSATGYAEWVSNGWKQLPWQDDSEN